MSFAPVVPLLILVGGAVMGAAGFAARKLHQQVQPLPPTFTKQSVGYDKSNEIDVNPAISVAFQP